jgi:predicted negative regulator of RcsB-dependent stress response
MKKHFILLAAVATFSFISCTNSTKKTEKEYEIVTVDVTEKQTYIAANTEVKFKDPKVATVYQSYINLKTALVNSNANSTADEAGHLKTAFANAGADEEVLLASQSIAGFTDVEMQRDGFVKITEAVEKMLEGAIESGVVYKQYCPMAFDFKGGYWLSNSNEINNPYFGDKMLRCGKVTNEIR